MEVQAGGSLGRAHITSTFLSWAAARPPAAAVGSYLEFYEFNQIVSGVSGRALTADCM